MIIAFVSFAAGLGLGAIAMLFVRSKQQKQASRKDVLVASAGTDYLSASGITGFNVTSLTLDDGRLMLLVEAEPQKKLRFSHIIEHMLKEHIQRQTGKTVDAVYWRFPIIGRDNVTSNMAYADAAPAATAEAQAPQVTQRPATEPEHEDLHSHDHRDHYEITEVNWEDFAAHSNQAQNPPEEPKDASGGDRRAS